MGYSATIEVFFMNMETPLCYVKQKNKQHTKYDLNYVKKKIYTKNDRIWIYYFYHLMVVNNLFLCFFRYLWLLPVFYSKHEFLWL